MPEANRHHPHIGSAANVGLSYWGKRIYAVLELLIEKKILSEDDVRRQVEYIESRSYVNGAKLVARAWVDPDFKSNLLTDPKRACYELEIDASGMQEFVVLENTDKVRHLVVCTLCSCYPRAILGRPPDWYKSLNYRKRAVVDPRSVILEFGNGIPDDVEVHVVDSSADIRYLVMPLRPIGTEHWNEEDLAGLVTRDSLIGVTEALSPVNPREVADDEL